MKLFTATIVLSLVAAAPAGAQLGDILKKAGQARDEVKSLTISAEDEQAIGAGVSERVRTRYGVVQDPAVHRYVALVGTVLAQASSRPGLPWTFVVLDTDGVNAFAAPGGYIHVTRGALALAHNEAELAGVLAHEITHVTEKHTVSAIQKNKLVQRGANEALKGNAALLNAYVDRAFEMVYAGFGRAEELEADQKGVALANKVGYEPHALAGFLARLNERNSAAQEKQGLFASHPETNERLDRLSKQVAADKLASTAALADRYRQFITYKPRPQTEITVVEPGSAGLTGGSGSKDAKGNDAKDRSAAASDPPKKSGAFGLGALAKAAGGSEKKSTEVTASGGSRGVDAERNAKGGSKPALVTVSLTPGDVAAFKKEGGLH
jgi:beta-barrel assembly-enhancing protease